MTRSTLLAVLAAFILVLAACVPEQKVSWSADGSRALIIAGDGLRLMQPDGRLSPILMPDATRADWIGKDTALVVRTVKLSTWKQAADILSSDERAAARHIGDYLLARLKQAPATTLNADAAFSNDPVLSSPQVASYAAYATLYALAQDPALPARLNAKPEEIVANASELLLCRVGDGKIAAAQRLAICPGAITGVRLNPVYDDVLYAAQRPGVDGLSLGVVPRAGGATAWLAAPANQQADWTSDGRAIVYAAGSVAGQKTTVGTLTRLGVFRSDGTLITDKQRPSADLARIALDEAAAVSVLADGRILVTSADLKLPAPAGDAVDRLYALNPHTSQLVAFDLPSADVGIACFTPSPDGRQVAALTSDGTLVVAPLAGPGPYRFTAVAKAGKALLAPTWRGGQITFAAEVDGAAQLALIVPGGKPTVLSTTWPNAVRKGMLDTADNITSARFNGDGRIDATVNQQHVVVTTAPGEVNVDVGGHAHSTIRSDTTR